MPGTHLSPVKSESLGVGLRHHNVLKLPRLQCAAEFAGLLQLQCAQESSTHLVRMQILIQWVRVRPEILISNKLQADACATLPRTTHQEARGQKTAPHQHVLFPASLAGLDRACVLGNSSTLLVAEAQRGTEAAQGHTEPGKAPHLCFFLLHSTASPNEQFHPPIQIPAHPGSVCETRPGRMSP